MKRIYDYPTCRELQPYFLEKYLEKLREARESAVVAQEYMRTEHFRELAESQGSTWARSYESSAVGGDWRHISRWPRGKQKEHGNFVDSRGDESELQVVALLAGMAIRVFGCIRLDGDLLAVYKWPRIIRVRNFEGTGLTAYAWHGRVRPC